MKINTKYELLTYVYIKELKIRGKILSIFVGPNKLVQYNIRYFSGLDYKDCYFYEDEISENEEDNKLGFINGK